MTAGAGGTARVLIVEDNDAHARLAEQVLESAGYACLRAANAELALDMIAADPPNLVLMDLRLPGMSGSEAVGRLRAMESSRSLPIILVTSYRGEFAAEDALRAGADAYIAKPYHYADLIDLARTLCGPGGTLT